ncbi:P-loop containing nucleoside triphosphate hydrolase protein [Xylona heveae TC161]|uniref:ATP-dependent RNA helicase ROK1 n=1 Tax=Xylona heveae (strain CBS 132557 / TC161) TaxID=1328760 RepID=A0A165GEA7_XYLHT|nr:P-loop containing nucleoside triphosphate hydrolase protein [Xylona heveae TC161]KZF22087.1 P-loop containing nucleoside triphosphate hydrolase protein [Xylona heveae TC161]
MDPFKLLTRSTNLTKAATASKKTASQHTPSTGQNANPQLFGGKDDDSSSNASKKRKRGNPSAVPDLVTEAELDFFGDGKSKNVSSKEKDDDDAGVPNEKNETSKFAKDTLSEEDCKRILRSHKLKITLLNATEPAAADNEGEKKSKKRKKEQATEHANSGKKKAHVQVFPQPLTSFKQLRSRYNISRRLADNLAAQGYTIPTEVQLGGLPLLLGDIGGLEGDKGAHTKSTTKQSLADVDLLTVAPTGSGKTLAFLIPVLNQILARRKAVKDNVEEEELEGPKAIVVAPTRELASQIVNEGRKLALGTGIRVTAMRKGMKPAATFPQDEEDESADEEQESGSDSDHSDSDESTSQEHNQNKKDSKTSKKQRPVVKADVLVTTPLLMLHAISLKGQSATASMPSVRHLILDEADVLLDPLFRDQTLGIWNACINPSLRVSLWSATMASSVEELALSTIESRAITLRLSTHAPLARLVVGLKDSAIPNISHRLIYAATEQGKLLALRQMLHPTSSISDDSSGPPLRPPFIVFTQTIPRAVALHSELLYDIPLEAGGSSRIAVLHSDLSDTLRSDVMARFRNGSVWVLITTDLLARGVDFRGVNGVVNYDFPSSGASYIHRVGRTGRAGRDGGVAVTLYTKEDIPYVKNVANIIAASEKLRRDERPSHKAAGPVSSQISSTIQPWLLDALPTPSKRDKQRLKRRGVEARRSDTAGPGTEAGAGTGARDGGSKSRISTKSGFDRKLENRRKGAKMASQKAKKSSSSSAAAAATAGTPAAHEEDSDGNEWGGFD